MTDHPQVRATPDDGGGEPVRARESDDQHAARVLGALGVAADVQAALDEHEQNRERADLVETAIARGEVVQASYHGQVVDNLANERDRAIETRENANAVSLRYESALRRIVENLDGADPDGNIFPAAALRIAREALGR